MEHDYVFEIRLPPSADADQIDEVLRRTLEERGKVSVLSASRDEALGMTGGEILISYVVSLAASVTVEMYKDEIRSAVRTTAEVVRATLDVIFSDSWD